MPVHHVSLATGPSHFKEMRDFYAAALKPFGYKVFMEEEGAFCGFQTYTGPDFWLHCGGVDFPHATAADVDEGEKPQHRGRTHVAFTASSHQQVDDWFKTALKSGGIANGAPGERRYVKGYYAAFVLDPVGNNVEAVYFNPLWIQAIKSAPWMLTALGGAVAGHFAMGYARATGWM